MLAGCLSRPAPLVPSGLPLAARDSAVEWAHATVPEGRRAIRFRWRYRDERVSYAGRGTARVAPPDSLRFDYAGPLGLGAGAAVVLGDSVAWADPAENFHSLVPAIPMLWASLGMVRAPAEGAVVFGRVGGDSDARSTVWRFAQARDTLDYVLTEGRGRVLEAEWRRDGKVVARSITRYQGAMPVSARIDFPEGPARFELTVGAVEALADIAPALWRARR